MERVETGIERHWREEREEADRVLRERIQAAMRGYANISPEEMELRMAVGMTNTAVSVIYSDQLRDYRGYAPSGLCDARESQARFANQSGQMHQDLSRQCTSLMAVFDRFGF